VRALVVAFIVASFPPPRLFLLDEFVVGPRLSPTPMNAGYADPEMHSSSTVI
jgi:hypothetical protein